MALIPENSLEQILNGDNVTPDDRLEYFVKKAIDNAGSGGGSSLPEPGTAGNVLTSTGDAWESSAPSASALMCTLTVGETTTCDKSVSEIVSAVKSGKDVFAVADGAVLELKMYDNTHVTFQLVNKDGNGIYLYTFTGSTNGEVDSWTSAPNFVEGLPSASGNNGKVLGVNNGAYALISPSALSNAPLYVAISQTGNTISTDKTAAEITGALDDGKAVILRYKVILGEGTHEEVTAWSEKTLVGAYHVSAEGYSLIYVEYDGDTDTWSKFTLTAATGADVFSYTST